MRYSKIFLVVMVIALMSNSLLADCGWWKSLSQQQRNDQIVRESLYAVDTDIAGQNRRIPCQWSEYLAGKCSLMGNWNYRGLGIGQGGECKDFVQKILLNATGNAVDLPRGTYDYRNVYPWRNKQDGIRYALPGEVMQSTSPILHTAIVITNFHDGRFEIVDSNWSSPYDQKIRKHVINVNGWSDVKFYVINADPCP